MLSTENKKIKKTDIPLTLSQIHKRKKEEKKEIKNPKNDIYTNDVFTKMISIIEGNCTTIKC